MRVTLANFVAIGRTVDEIGPYGDLTVLKMSAVRHLGFIKFEILTPIWLRECVQC